MLTSSGLELSNLTSILSTRNPKFLNQLVKAGSADLQFNCSTRQISFVPCQGRFDHLALDSLAGFSEALPHVLGIRGIQPEVLMSDPAVFGHDCRSLDSVLQFSN